jgi:multidrug efflux pump subunit AcrA (membrane-fusion protein)
MLLVRTGIPPAVLLLLAASVGCHSQDSPAETVDTEPPPVPVTTAVVEVRPVQRRVAVVGTLFGFEQVTVTPKVEGRVSRSHCDVGDRVVANAVLLEIDSTDYRLAAEEAQRSLEQELARLNIAEPPGDDFDIEALPSVEQARLVLENARRQYDRQRTLRLSNAASEQAYEQAETEQKVADAALRQARLEAKTILAAVRHQQAVLAVSQQRLSETEVAAPALPGASESDVPTTGFVVAQRMVSVGEMVRAFPSVPVYELIVDDVLKLKVKVP